MEFEKSWNCQRILQMNPFWKQSHAGIMELLISVIETMDSFHVKQTTKI